MYFELSCALNVLPLRTFSWPDSFEDIPHGLLAFVLGSFRNWFYAQLISFSQHVWIEELKTWSIVVVDMPWILDLAEAWLSKTQLNFPFFIENLDWTGLNLICCWASSHEESIRSHFNCFAGVLTSIYQHQLNSAENNCCSPQYTWAFTDKMEYFSKYMSTCAKYNIFETKLFSFFLTCTLSSLLTILGSSCAV